MQIVLCSSGYKNFETLRRTRSLISSTLPTVTRPRKSRVVKTTNNFTEVAQQSKARRKDDFIIAFSPVCVDHIFAARFNGTNENRSLQKPQQSRTKVHLVIFNKRYGGWLRSGDNAVFLSYQFKKLSKLVLMVCHLPSLRLPQANEHRIGQEPFLGEEAYARRLAVQCRLYTARTPAACTASAQCLKGLCGIRYGGQYRQCRV